MIPSQLKEEGLKFLLIKPRDKLPIENNWQKQNNYPHNNMILLQHLEVGGNYGVLCGGGLIVMDADTEEFDKIIQSNFPETFTVKTKSGKHYYYFTVGFEKKKVLKNGNQHLGEIQSTGSFVVAPNSIHPSGIKYEVFKDVPIVKIDKDDIDKVLNSFYSNERIGKDIILKGASAGLRNDSMFKIACSFRQKKLNAEETYLVLKTINEKNSPPLPESELKGLINSAYTYKEDFKIKEAIQVFNEDYIEMAEKFYIIQPYYYDKYKIWWLWNFENTCWEMVDVIDLLNQLKKQLSPWVSITKTNVFSQVQRALEMVGRGKKPEDCSKNFIQFKNKIYDLATKRTYPVKSSYFATNPIPWEIGESIETPIMDQLFKDWVGEKYVQTLYEIIAYCCYSDYPIHLIFCFIGVGRNGKTKYQQLISRFLGENNISSTELDLLLGNRFESIKLFKKLACTLGETNFGVMSKTSLLKKLSGQDLIGFEMKNKTPFDGYNYAKIIINSNSLPSSEDTSEGFYRRWFIIDFPNQFPEGNDILNTIPDVEYNNLALKVIGILPKLLESGQFTNQGTIEQRRDQYVFASNPLEKFIDTWCEESGEYVRYSTLYTAYIKFLKQNKRRIISKKEFTKSLDIQGFEIRKTNKKIGDVFVNDRFVEGLELKDKALDYGVNMILPHFL